MRVGLLCVDVDELAVEDKVGSKRAERSGDMASDEGEREHGAVLRCSARVRARQKGAHLVTRVEQEFVGVHAVRHGAADDGHVVKHDRRARRILGRELGRRQQERLRRTSRLPSLTHELVQHIQDDDARKDGGERGHRDGDRGEESHLRCQPTPRPRASSPKSKRF